MILGLTGGYCTGKNSMARILEQAGWACIDVDRLGHRALESRIDEVATLLGPSVRKADGAPDRKAIGALVFADEALLKRYEAIVHPAMNRLCDEAIDDALADGRKVCVNAALLYRLPQASRCDRIVQVDAPLCKRVARGMRRDGISPLRILQRIASQRSFLSLAPRFADRLTRLHNPGSPERFEAAVNAFLSRLEA